MKARNKVEEETGPGVPAFIVTFSDMVTLLLTFFVMLLSLAKEQVDDHKFMQGSSSFKRALSDFGLTGALFSAGSGPDFDHPMVKYKVPKEEDDTRDNTDTKSKDHHTEMLRRIVMDIERKMKVSPSQLTGTSKTFMPTPIKFETGKSLLDDSARRFLDNYAGNMQESLTGQHTILYVVGLAASESSLPDQWMVSARRAQAVADYIRSKVPKGVDLSLYSWGSGPGGEWADHTGFMDKTTQIMIATLVDDEF